MSGPSDTRLGRTLIILATPLIFPILAMAVMLLTIHDRIFGLITRLFAWWWNGDQEGEDT